MRAIPQPNVQAAPYDTDAELINGRYVFTTNVPDEVRCVVRLLPSHDTYSCAPGSLAGSITSTYDQGCGGAPAGADTYDFVLVRF